MGQENLNLTLAAIALLGLLEAVPTTAQGVEIHNEGILIGDDRALTTADGVSVYARGTGFWNPAPRLVKTSFGEVANTFREYRGLMLTVVDPQSLVFTSVVYDTFAGAEESNSLAALMASVEPDEIGILTSYDAFEQNITDALRAQAGRLGLFKLASLVSSDDQSTWRHPYAAIFRGTGAPNPVPQAVEILHSNSGQSPHAVLATWLIGDGFVGQTAIQTRPAPPCFDSDHRFVNCGNGTVTDTGSGLIYLEKANCFGQQDWQTANGSATSLSSGECGLSDGSREGDWRLQTVEEWEGILDPDCATDPPSIVGNGSSPGCYADNAGADEWASGVQSAWYWSSSAYVPGPTVAWGVSLNNGEAGSDGKGSGGYVWPVRGGQ